ncbi:HAD family hydrolase [Ktedonosporobacter rubrisoli]|uniref:HAD family hydrolase n=1 Tax=Ktedonosporobacter rubrisoli TaxID=2509675 RepID=A0A4P6JW24_KTERU|nr:HAD family hydrolase [Ktedonosporobacter rubrisoli]QBD79572.1 HAD family hydrolase [Ktedonosporobacter rubrisoli]
MARQLHGVILDVDGTLIDSNDAHAHAWVQALEENGEHVPFARLRPLIGMGGDKVLPETIGVQKDSPKGEKISKRHKELFMHEYLPRLHAFPQTFELLKRMHEQGLKLVVATSAEPDELNGLLRLISPQASDFFTQETSAKDAPESKPNPDIMQAALKRSGCTPEQVVMIGDTAYDIEAATRAGVKTLAFRCGGWSDEGLRGALAIYDGPADLLANYDSSPLVQGL